MDNKRTILPNGRYTDDELELLKKVFAENLPLIKVLRKVMLQLEMSESEEIQWHKAFSNKPLNDLMRKMFLPTIDGDAPIHQVIDLWMTLDLNNKMMDEAQSIINSRKLVIDYLDGQLKVLAGEIKENPSSLNQFNVLSIDELKARNTIIAHIENQLNEIYGLAGYKKETPEETLKRLKQDSSK